MKNLTKILFPALFSSILTLNYSNAKAQDIPKRILDYQHSKENIVLDSRIVPFWDSKTFYGERIIDVNRDSIPDVIEVYPLKIDYSTFKITKEKDFPRYYILLPGYEENIKIIFDPKEDGLGNKNEKVFEGEFEVKKFEFINKM